MYFIDNVTSRLVCGIRPSITAARCNRKPSHSVEAAAHCNWRWMLCTNYETCVLYIDIVVS